MWIIAGQEKGETMQPILQAITGKENQGDLSTSYQALVQFYCAFNSRDMHMMSQNWAQSDEIVMNNPLGGIKRGWSEVRPVYEQLFSGSTEVYVEYCDYTIHSTANVFYAVGWDRGYFRSGSERIQLSIRVSRIFRKINSRWRQVHYHGSIEDSLLLAQYQAALLGEGA